MRKNLLLINSVVSLVLVFFSALLSPAFFYQGKNIRFIVGFAAAGGYDAYTRLVAKYISRHIPGQPSTVVENMDGAGSVIATNYLYNKAEKDGLTVVFGIHTTSSIR